MARPKKKIDVKPRDINDLRAAPYNPRSIQPDALAGLQASIGEFGDVSGLVFNTSSFRVDITIGSTSHAGMQYERGRLPSGQATGSRRRYGALKSRRFRRKRGRCEHAARHTEAHRVHGPSDSQPRCEGGRCLRSVPGFWHHPHRLRTTGPPLLRNRDRAEIR